MAAPSIAWLIILALPWSRSLILSPALRVIMRPSSRSIVVVTIPQRFPRTEVHQPAGLCVLADIVDPRDCIACCQCHDLLPTLEAGKSSALRRFIATRSSDN
jgi:hypothetical protein